MATATATGFRTPLLCYVCRINAWVSLAVFAATACGIYFVGDSDFLVRAATAGGLILSGIAYWVISFGIGEVIGYIGRSAYHLERIDAAMRKASRPSSPASHAPALAPVSADTPRLTGLDSATVASCPSCMAELDVRTLRRGSNRCPSCGVAFTAE